MAMSEPEPLLTEEEEEDPESMSMQTAAPAPWHRRGAVALAAMAVLAVAAVALLTSHRVGGAVFPGGEVVSLADAHEVADSVEISAEEDPCSGYPHLHLKKAIHSNLGGKGPDSGAEGLVYDATALVPAESGHEAVEKPCHVKINVVEGAYTPWPGMHNGMHGFYGSIVLKSGTSVQLKVTIVDKDTGEPFKVRRASFTFFDLDEDHDGKSQESVTIGGMQKVILAEHTEIVTTVNRDGTKTFAATKYGTGEDNPSNPLTLNQEQRNRAVTVDFDDVSEIPLTLSATAGTGPRVFIFVGRPSLKCAKGVHYKGAAAGQQTALLLVTALVGLSLFSLSPA